MVNCSKEELHLFILWKNARLKEQEILQDIKSKFYVISKLELHWNDSLYSSNLSRFYGEKLPDRSFKEKHCGRGPFLLVVVRDNNPVYEYRNTSKGSELVNINLFDKKMRYRSLTGGGHKIHSTNSREEFNHDITLLLHKSAKDFSSSEYFNKNEKVSLDLPGAAGWKNLGEMLYVLNNTIKYVVMRNFQYDSELTISEQHPDIDLMVENKKKAVFLMNGTKLSKLFYRVNYQVKIGSSTVNIDLRSPGDKYYDTRWQEEILNTRVKAGIGYFPCKEHFFYSLVYHGLIHKREFSEDYLDIVKCLASELKLTPPASLGDLKLLLSNFMKKRNYHITYPIDFTVYYNEFFGGRLPGLSPRKVYNLFINS